MKVCPKLLENKNYTSLNKERFPFIYLEDSKIGIER
jgi:hypothetical protein